MFATVAICAVIFILILAGILTFRKHLRSGCCAGGSDAAPKKIRVKDRNVRHYPYLKILRIDGMVCQNCASRVQNALNSIDGTYASVDLGKQEADVRMKTPLPDELLRRTVARAGYTVLSVAEAMSH